jgi:signal transduction histidine kinase
MTTTRWWHVAVVGTAVVLEAILVLFTSPASHQILVGSVAIGLLLVAWFCLGSRCIDDSLGMIAFIVLLVILAGAINFTNPYGAIVQCIAFPLIWTRLSRLPTIIAANIALAVAVGAGFVLPIDDQVEFRIVEAFAIEGISLAFSMGLGLWISSIAKQSDERRRLLDELRSAQAELALLNRDAGVTSERDRLAREIHDTIAQDLTGIVLVAQRASRELAAGESPAASIELLEESARAALAETRSLVAATASPGLEGGVAAALARLAERFQRETGVVVSAEVVASDPGAVAADRDTEVVLLRCAQEGLANVRKHAGASRVSIVLEGRTLEISDDGRGFDVGSESSGFGLSGMRERLALIGGSIDIASSADGTTLRVLA